MSQPFVIKQAQPAFTPPALSLYIHLPWCVEKCPYCDFNSHKIPDDFNEENYLNALIIDVENSLPLIWGRPIRSVFLGGGTPSLFSGEGIQYLLSQLRARLSLFPQTEITLEANPNSTDQNHFKNYLAAGINRISIGAQSFNNQHLNQLGRIHDSNNIRQAFITARESGFNNINLDIMFGLPSQTIQSALDDLQSAIDLQPEHISWYQLTIEANTVFGHSPPEQLPEHDLLYEMQQAGLSLLSKHHFERYEISAFTQKNHCCQHNLNYWQFGDYLGVGAGAHGKLSFHDKIIRTTKHRNPKDYLQQTNKTKTTEAIQTKDLPFEFMLNALRLTQGFDLALYTKQTQRPLSDVQAIIKQAIDQDFLKQKNNLIFPTTKGINFHNDCLALFLKE